MVDCVGLGTSAQLCFFVYLHSSVFFLGLAGKRDIVIAAHRSQVQIVAGGSLSVAILNCC
jgi:hypothetical protein